MTSPLPPRLRDTRSLADRSRQDRNNLKQLGVGFVGGRFSPAKPLGATSQFGDLEDDAAEDIIVFTNTDRATTTGAGNATMRLTHLPLDGSEHVSWHPAGGGGVHLTAADWTRTDQIVTIPAFDGLAAGDVFTCEYAYVAAEDVDQISPTLIGVSVASGAAPGYTISIPLPTGTQDGDLIVIAARGVVAAGGGDLTLGFSSADARVAPQYGATAPPVAEGIFTGFATSSAADVVINIIPNPSYTGSADAAMAVFRGVNNVGEMSVSNTGSLNTTSPTPRVSGLAAVAVTWAGNNSFGIFGASTPDGYTFATYTGLAYGATTISWWYDPDGDTSPAGNYTTCEGCCVFALV